MDDKWFKTIDGKGKWIKSLQNIPEITLETIKKHLITSNKTYDRAAVKAYKCLKAYKFFYEGYVQKICICQANFAKEDVTVCKAEILASMSKKIYRTFVCLNEAGQILGATCTCVAG